LISGELAIYPHVFPNIQHKEAKRPDDFRSLGFSVFLATFGASAPPAQTQIIECQPGWNLISVQVGNAPIPFATFESELDDPGKLIVMWGYHATGVLSIPGK